MNRSTLNPHLFVYGTLRSDSTSRMGRAQRQRLGREGRSLGAATLPGRLYDLGRYPGLVDSDKAGELVHGEVIALADPAVSLPWLDAYEGIRPDNAGTAEYERLERRAQLASGGALLAWVYICRQDVSRATAITDGRWR